MELVLTKQQKKVLDSSPIKSASLQRAYKKSVQDQKKILNAAIKTKSSK